MEPHFHLSRREKTDMVLTYLRGSLGYFVIALICACLGMVFNALTPQVIRITVDSILDTEPANLPGFLENIIPLESLRAEPLTALWIAAGAVLLFAILRGLCNYGQRLNLAKGSEGFVKRIRDGLFSHSQHHSDAWYTAHSSGDMAPR